MAAVAGGDGHDHGAALRLMPHLVRAVPHVAPLRPLYVTTSLMSLLMLTATNPGQATARFRLGAAAIAACLAFLLDDDAATTTASVPATRFARRSARVAVGAAVFGTWLVGAACVADLLTGAGRPPWQAFLEPVTVAAIGVAVSCLATDRFDDAAGVFGTAAAITCFATAYLPPRWWWPLTAQPETTRLLVIGGAALAVAAVASIDPAVRRPRVAR